MRHEIVIFYRARALGSSLTRKFYYFLTNVYEQEINGNLDISARTARKSAANMN